MQVMFKVPENLGTHHVINKKGDHVLIYKDAGTYKFEHSAKKFPTKHLHIHKLVKRIINKLCKFIDSRFFYN